MTITQLLRDTRVDKDPSREFYTIDSEKSADIIDAIKSGDVLLGDGQIYILIEEGSKELVIGNSSDTYDSAFKVSGGGDGPITVTWANVSGKPSTFTPSAHTHVIGDVTGLQAELDGFATSAELTSGLAGKANTSHTHTIAQVTGLQGELDSKADSTDIPDVSGFATTSALTTGLAGKANTSHTHTVAQVTGLQGELDSKLTATEGAAVADSADETDVVVQFNALLASLRTAGVISS